MEYLVFEGPCVLFTVNDVFRISADSPEAAGEAFLKTSKSLVDLRDEITLVVVPAAEMVVQHYRFDRRVSLSGRLVSSERMGNNSRKSS